MCMGYWTIVFFSKMYSTQSDVRREVLSLGVVMPFFPFFLLFFLLHLIRMEGGKLLFQKALLLRIPF